MTEPVLSEDDPFAVAFIESFEKFPISVDGDPKHPRAANLHAAYYGLKELGIEVDQDLEDAFRSGKDLTENEAESLAKKCALKFVPLWIEANLDAYFYYTLTRPVSLKELSKNSIKACEEWLIRAEDELLKVSDHAIILDKSLGFKETPCFISAKGQNISIHVTMALLVKWIAHLIEQNAIDFESLAELNEKVRISFEGALTEKTFFKVEAHQIGLTALGAVLVRNVLIADINETLNWRIQDKLLSQFLIEEDLSFPDFISHGNLSQYLDAHKALSEHFTSRSIPKEKHWDYVRYAVKYSIDKSIDKLNDDFPLETKSNTATLSQEPESFIELYWEKSGLKTQYPFKDAIKKIQRINFLLGKQSSGGTIKLEGMFRALYQEGRFEEESRDAILALVESDETSYHEAYRNIQKVLDINAHPHYLLSKSETAAILGKLKFEEKIDGTLKARLNSENVLIRDGAEDALVEHFFNYLKNNFGDDYLEGEWEEAPNILMKTYAASSVTLAELQDIVFEIFYNAYEKGEKTSIETLVEALNKVLTEEKPSSAESLEVSKNDCVPEIQVNFYEISLNGSKKGIFSESLKQLGSDVIRRVKSLIELNKLVSKNSPRHLVHSQPLKVSGMWELCSVGAVRVIYCRTTKGDIVLLEALDKKGRDWVQVDAIERCRILKNRIDSEDPEVRLIEV